MNLSLEPSAVDLNRLREIVRGGAPPRAPVVPPRRELTYEPVGPDGLPIAAREELPALAGAALVDTPFGRAVILDHEYPPEFLHGRVPVEDLCLCDREVLALVNGRPLGADEDHGATSLLFFDLETTGLSGGAGTVPFLVGCGYFDDGGGFRTRQFFLAGFAGERALLHAAGEFFARFTVLVTYNGRSFDVPVMETRWLFHRMAPALEGMAHLDMLPPARRLWRDAAENAERSCRLVALEHALCGVVRVGDVPGMEIPQRFFEYVRHGDARVLEPVLYHNRMDLLSLAALTARAQRLVRDGADAAIDPAECLALGRLLERRGRALEAEQCYRRAAADRVGPCAVRDGALHSLALLLRRARRYGEAAAVWNDLVSGGVGRSPLLREAVQALAIHHEHRDRDLHRAQDLALRALRTERDPRGREELLYRLARIERKLAAASRAPSSMHQPSLVP